MSRLVPGIAMLVAAIGLVDCSRYDAVVIDSNQRDTQSAPLSTDQPGDSLIPDSETNSEADTDTRTSEMPTDTGDIDDCDDFAAVDPEAVSSDQPFPESTLPLPGLEEQLLRDPFIMLGPDGYYYLTGTTAPDIRTDYDGIELWRSSDLMGWEYLGFVWTFEEDAEEGCWCGEHYPYVVDDEEYLIRVPWAPEIHYINGDWWIPFALPGGATGILKSKTGLPTGPYINGITAGEGYIAKRHVNPSLFQDDDGTVYYVEDNAAIARMLDDMSGLADPLTLMAVASGGNDGAAIFKVFDRYYLSLSKYYDESEDLYVHVVQSADNIYGPYGNAHEVISNQPGDLTFFRDKACDWWMTIFGTAETSSFDGRPAIVPVEFDSNRFIRLDLDRL